MSWVVHPQPYQQEIWYLPTTLMADPMHNCASHQWRPKAGKMQDIFLVGKGALCPLAALCNLIKVVPAGAVDPLFSWTDHNGAVQPMVKSTVLSKFNIILSMAGFGLAFNHSSCIGGASFYLAKGVPSKIVHIHGQWNSLAYEVYICSFEQITSKHLVHKV